ncbi:hypothetical protein QFC22_002548 [Naganishia vaughanmartiniae]|uniref:Uncharacterized protein n=1 Tax=Naganishia vaughanmartiniae TaxID=1424756 RepID=A0ACC2XB28_9TREE|nr:hypothetical protein QFC22_002548 [Naganishia vaughanmartiniae]
MEELPGIIIAVIVIFFIARYFSGSKQKAGPISVGADGTPTSGPLRGVSTSMIETVHATFPHVSVNAIVYSLSKTKSVQTTSETILEQGFLPEPPATFPKHPYIETLAPSPPNSATAAHAPSSETKHQSLIERYNLTAAARAQEKGKARQADESITENVKDNNKAWNADKSAREKILQDRKAKMILEARQRMLEKQAAQKLKQSQI